MVAQGDLQHAADVWQVGRRDSELLARKLGRAQPVEARRTNAVALTGAQQHTAIEGGVVRDHDPRGAKQGAELVPNLRKRLGGHHAILLDPVDRKVSRTHARGPDERPSALHDAPALDPHEAPRTRAVVATIGRFEVDGREVVGDHDGVEER